MNECEGCCVLNRCFYIDYAIICPCRMCLIKMICNDPCDKYRKFQRQAEKEKGYEQLMYDVKELSQGEYKKTIYGAVKRK